MKKTLSVSIIAVLVLSLFLPLTNAIGIKPLAGETVSIINPGPDSYPTKWNASTTVRDLGTPNFIFYTNETAVNSTFFFNVTVSAVQRMRGWGIGIVFDNTTIRYVSDWRPSDHVFKPVEDLGWSTFPTKSLDPVNATHAIIKLGYTYIIPDGEFWSFNGTGLLCQVQFKIVKQVDQTNRKATLPLAFDPAWTTLYQYPSGVVTPTTVDGYFEYTWPYNILTVTASAGGTTNPAPDVYYHSWNATASVTAIPDTGYFLDRWERNGINIGSTNPVTVTMDADYTLRAVFSIPNPVLKLEPSSYTALRVGENVNLNVTIQDLSALWRMVSLQFALVYNTSIFEFVKWQNTSFLESFVNDGENSVLYAETHDYHNDGAGHGDPTLPVCYNKILVGAFIWPDLSAVWHEPYPSGTGVIGTITLRVTALPPVSCLLTLNETELWTNSTTQIPHTVEHASFSFPEETRKLTITTTTGGTTNPAPGEHNYPIGTNATVEASAFSNYFFDHWERNGTDIGSTNPVNITMDNDYVLNAVFSLINRTLTITTTTGGTTSPLPGAYTYANGTAVDVTALPSNNNMLSYWERNGTNIGSANPITIIMDASYTLRAVFSLINRTLNITATTGGTTDPVPGIYTYVNGTVVTVNATAAVGYNFTVWILDGVNKTGTSITITMDMNHTLQAVFSDITAPTIGTPTQEPAANNVQANQAVKIRVNVTDLGSLVKNVTLMFTNDTTWFSITMTFNSTSGFWEASIPGHILGKLVKYKIEAFDNAGNHAINDNATVLFAYTVIPEFPQLAMLIVFMLVTAIAMLVSTSKLRKIKGLK